MRKNFLTISEVSEYLKLPEETVYKYARAGRIPASKVGRYWRFDVDQIDQWMAGHSNAPRHEMKILVVDDEPMVRELVCKWLSDFGCEVDCAGGGEEAVGFMEAQKYNVVLLDLMMPAVNGVETLKEIRKIDPQANVVILTAYMESALMDRALEQGPVTILKKPVIKDTLLSLISVYQERSAKA